MKNLNKPFINPFDYIDTEKIRKKVNSLKDLHPDWEKEDICRELVKKKSRLCASSGALSALPSSIPGLGTIVTIVGGTAVDLTALVFFLSELTIEIATVYNRNPSTDATKKEALWVLSSCFGVESAAVGVSKVAGINLSKRALAVLIEKLFTIIGGWLTKGILLRMLPVVGSLVNAYINTKACKHAGKEVVLWYKTNEEQDLDWGKSGEGKEEDFIDDDIKDDIPDENIIFEPMDEGEDLNVYEDISSDILIEEPEEIEIESPEEIIEEDMNITVEEREEFLSEDDNERDEIFEDIIEGEVITSEVIDIRADEEDKKTDQIFETKISDNEREEVIKDKEIKAEVDEKKEAPEKAEEIKITSDPLEEGAIEEDASVEIITPEEADLTLEEELEEGNPESEEEKKNNIKDITGKGVKKVFKKKKKN